MLPGPSVKQPARIALLGVVGGILLFAIACSLTAQTTVQPYQVQVWVRLLESDDVQQRSFAANALVASQSKDALAALRAALAPERRNAVRITVIKAFQFAGNDEAADLLVSALDDKSEQVSQAAAEALAEIRTPNAVNHLKAKAADEKATVHARTQVIAILGEMRELRVVEMLIGLLGNNDTQVAKSARAALELITYQKFETSFEWANWWEQARKRNRVQLLEDQVKRQTEQLNRTQRIVARLYLKLIRERKDKDDPSLLIEALSESGSVEVQLYAITQMTQIEPKNTEAGNAITTALVKALQEESYRVRTKAAESLGTRNDPVVISGLVEALDDGVPSVRQAAAKSLGSLGARATAAINALNSLLKDKETVVVAAAAVALGQIGSPKAIEPLTRTLRNHTNNPQSPVYEAAGQALAGIADPRVLDLLAGELIQSANVKVRYAAAGALGRYGRSAPAQALPVLTRVLKEETNPQVRSRAITALAETGRREAVAILLAALSDKDKAIREQALASILILAKGKKDWFADIIRQLLKDKDYDLAEHILGSAVDQFKVLPNHIKDTAELRSLLAQGMMAAGEFRRAKPHFAQLYTADNKNVANLGALVSCSAALGEYEAIETLLAQARKNIPEQKAALWAETAKFAQVLFDAEKHAEVVALIDRLANEDQALGTPESASALNDLRKKSAAKLPVPAGAAAP